MVATTVQLLGNLTVPLITLAIGFELQLNRETFKAPLLAALVRILTMFALATLINKFLIRDLLHLEPAFRDRPDDALSPPAAFCHPDPDVR